MENDNGISKLTPCEFKVFQFTAVGFTINQTAYHLKRSPDTINNHKRSIYQKTGARSVVDIAWLYSAYKKGAKIDLKELKKSVMAAVMLFMMLPGVILGDFDKRLFRVQRKQAAIRANIKVRKQ